MNLKRISIIKRKGLFSFLYLYPYKIILVDLDTNRYYSDYMNEFGMCKNFKPVFEIKEK